MSSSGSSTGAGDRPESSENVVVIERELRRLLRRSRAYATELARQVHPDLDPAVYALLVDIVEAGPSRAADLADERGITKGVISRQVGTLERLRLLERTPDPSDARAHLLAASAAGRRAVRRSQAERRQAFERLLASCTPEELSSMAQSLSRINELLE